MYLLIHHLAVEDLEGIQVNALVEGEDGIADGGVVGQAQILLRGARGRSWVTMPVGENLQAIGSGIFEGNKLVLGGEGEML